MAADSLPDWLSGGSKSESGGDAAPAESAKTELSLDLKQAPTSPKEEKPAPESNLGDALNEPPKETTPPKEVPKADGEKQKTEEKRGDGEKPEAGEYEAFTLPDGYAIADQDLKVFTDIAKEAGLPQEKAQRLVDLAVGVVESTRQQIAQETQAEAQQVRDEWRTALLKDPELGGAKLKATQENLNMFQRSKFASPELVSLLQESGLIMHPSIARLLSQIGASLKETPVGFGGDQPKQQRSPAHEIYSKSGHV
ncbi:MAG: hypothetical protein ACKVOG_12855 [Rhodoglobus sp.]